MVGWFPRRGCGRGLNFPAPKRFLLSGRHRTQVEAIPMGARGRKSAAELATPPLQLVEPTLPLELPPAPVHLSPAMRSWWDAVVRDYELDVHHLKILEAAADAWDRMAQARFVLDLPSRRVRPFTARANDERRKSEYTREPFERGTWMLIEFDRERWRFQQIFLARPSRRRERG